jgi:spoIIIJ-associated protein
MSEPRTEPVTDSDTAAPETAAPETEAPETEAPEDAVDTDEVAAPTEPVAESDDDDDENAEDGETDDGKPRPSRSERLVLEGEIAADYLEELLEITDLDGDLDMDVEGDRAAVSIVGGNVDQLVGHDGEVLEALQELTRLAVYRETGERSRLMLDVGGFRADKRTRLEKLAAEAVAEVKDSGERKALGAMSPFERKVVHDAVAAAGLSSESEGEEPRRHVVVLPS